MPALLGPKQWEAYEELAAPPPPGLESYRDLEMIDFGAASERMAEAAAHQPLYGIPLFVLSRAQACGTAADRACRFLAERVRGDMAQGTR